MVDIQEICDRAVSGYGRTYAAEIDVKTIQLMPEIREMCAADRCRMYGKNWGCPPAIGGLDILSKKLEGYACGAIFQTVGRLEDDFDYETMVETERKHKEDFTRLYTDLMKSYPDLLPMPAGACSLCPVCAYPEPCRFLDRVFPSMEAYGIFVSRLCQLNGFPYSHGPRTVAFDSCILFR